MRKFRAANLIDMGKTMREVEDIGPLGQWGRQNAPELTYQERMRRVSWRVYLSGR